MRLVEKLPTASWDKDKFMLPLTSHLMAVLEKLSPEPGRVLVAYSGGVDSHVLLSCLAALPKKFSQRGVALHVDHGLCDDSAGWVSHCRHQCDLLGIRFLHGKVNVSAASGNGPEDKARSARYEWLMQQLSETDVLLTAHHRSDQAETVVYNLMRGSGANGLAGIARLKSLQGFRLLRPFIDVDKESILDHAQEQKLQFISDPSNADDRFDRNFLRNQIIPQIEQRWPKASARIARAADHLGELRQLNIDLAQIDLEGCVRTEAYNLFNDAPVLDCTRLLRLSKPRRNNLLRQWLSEANSPPLTSRRLSYVNRHLVERSGSNSFSWSGMEIHRYRELLYLHHCRQIEPLSLTNWDIHQPLMFSGSGLVLRAVEASKQGQGLKIPPNSLLEISVGPGKRQFRRAPGNSAHSLKKIFQNAAIPPFLRLFVPVVSLEGVTLCVPGVWESEFFRESSRSGQEFNLSHQKSLS
ncbi:MAG: tRNA(Ile)-lysidine synthase [Parasphingorhabdus sp.]